MLEIGSEDKSKPRFELVVQVRNNDGIPTGRTKTFTTDKADDLEQLWNRNSFKAKKKKKKNIAAAAKLNQVPEALKEVELHIQQIEKERQSNE